jgi:guanylate kinase
MQKSRDEISHWNEYDYVVVNHDLQDTLNRVMAILHAERVRRSRQEGLDGFVAQLMAEAL